MPIKLTTYYHSKDIPELPGNNTFHSKALFLVYEATKGYTPLLIVATDHGKPVGKLLALFRKVQNHFPLSLLKHCIVYDTGEYLGSPEEISKEIVFGELLEHLTQEALREAAIIEFRNLENALFGYKYFRKNQYFNVNWLRVRNSLHDIQVVEERFSPSRIRQIRKSLQSGATVSEVQTEKELADFAKMLHQVYSSRIRRYFPDNSFFEYMKTFLGEKESGKIFIVNYKGKIIGGSVCLYSADTAFLLFSGGMRKTYASQHPGILAVWMAFKYAHEKGYRHLEFMDVGLPFKKHGYRNFVLRFGGKQSSTRRWFRFKWDWLNNLMLKLYM